MNLVRDLERDLEREVEVEVEVDLERKEVEVEVDIPDNNLKHTHSPMTKTVGNYFHIFSTNNIFWILQDFSIDPNGEGTNDPTHRL